ncbi:MAG: class II D-tagatose-bisphosphate aldolase, non-catalytic subunit [Nocardioides sp.]
MGEGGSRVRAVLDEAMLADPGHWRPFYPEDPGEAAYARAWSRSDRSRYYWSRPDVRAAVDRLLANLRTSGIPAELASQYLPWLLEDGVPGAALPALDPEDVCRAAVRRVLEGYAAATPA